MSHGRLCRATGCQRVFVRCFSRENETKTQAFHAFRAMLATVCLCCLSMCPRSFSKSRNDREPKPSRWGAKGRRQNTKGTATDLRTPNSSLASGPHLAALHGDFRFTRARRGFWGRNSPNCFRTAAKSASQPLYCADLCLFFRKNDVLSGYPMDPQATSGSPFGWSRYDRGEPCVTEDWSQRSLASVTAQPSSSQVDGRVAGWNCPCSSMVEGSNNSNGRWTETCLVRPHVVILRWTDRTSDLLGGCGVHHIQTRGTR